MAEAGGYHMRDIVRGEVGKLSKVREELEEAVEAEEQGNRLMVLQELSDLIGAVECYLREQFHGEFGTEDLIRMARATGRAFAKGDRK